MIDISIAIPTYEYGGRGVEFLTHSFNKILSQTFKNFEVVISDHSLNDDIQNLCKEWNNRFEIKYCKNDRGRGIISPNINVAMENCKGEYIKVLFQDDFLYNELSLEKTFSFIKSNDVNWLMTTFYHSVDGVNMVRPFVPVWNNSIWLGNNTMGCPSGMTIKNENIIYFDESLNWLMDCDYYQKMFNLYGEPKILNEFTVVNRTWGERLSDTTNQEVILKETKMMLDRYAYDKFR